MITISVNKKQYQVSHDTSLQALLEQLAIDAASTAVAVNSTVIPKAEYSRRQLAEGDNVLIIKAFYGG